MSTDNYDKNNENKNIVEEQTDKNLTQTDQDVYKPIKESEKVKGIHMFMVFVGMFISMYSVNIGMAVGQSMAIIPAITSIVLGYAIAGICAMVIGIIGVRTGLNSYVLAKGPMNWMGQIFISFIMFITIGVGSLGLQADTVGRAIAQTIPQIGYSPILSGLVCAVMMISAILGIKYMTVVSWFTMPFFFVISLFATSKAIGQFGGWSALLEIQNNTLSFSESVFLNAGAWAGGVMLMSDLTRFLKTEKEVIKIVPSAFIIGSIPPICGAILGAILQTSLDTVFVSLGIGTIGLISIIGIGWTTNDNNAYTAGLALTTALYPFKRMKRSRVTIIVAIVGVIGAMTGIGNLDFITWISSFHGSFNMSFAGVLIAHYLVVSRDKFVQTKGIAGIISWLVSGLLTYHNLLPLPFITNIVLAFVLYIILYYGVEKKIYGEMVVDKITPKLFN